MPRSDALSFLYEKHTMRQDKYEYDAFISHAVEDKIPIANELCARLEMAGLKIWYSGKELGVGDSIEKTIEKGLNRSRYGIVIFSPTYLAKNWTIREFYTLLAKEIEEQKVILPVLYNITLDELKNKDLLMADRFAVNADLGLDFVVDRLVREIRKPKLEKAKVAWFSRMWMFLMLSLLVNVALIVKAVFSGPVERVVQAQVAAEPVMMTSGLLTEMRTLVRDFNGETCSCREGKSRRPAPAFTRLASNHEERLRVDAPQQDGGQNTPQHHAEKSRSKVTMAVVFQIGNIPEKEQHQEDPVDNIIKEINLDEDQDRFITVANREFNGSHHECLHGSHLAD